MTDLTKIDTPFGELADATRGALLLAHHRGATIEVVGPDVTRWMECDPNWNPKLSYRVAPPPVVYDSIDWSHVTPGLDYLARDKDGETFFYSDRPSISGRFWNGGKWAVCSGFASYVRGTCDWKDSLVIRPGVGVAK